MTAGALAGVRVLEFGEGIPGAFAARLLGDLGAEVVKIEAPGGDAARRMAPMAPDGTTSLLFEYLNWGKRGVVLDAQAPRDRAATSALAAGADLVIETRGPGDLAAWGCTPQRMGEAHPALVVTSVSPFGATGPYADWRAGDLVLQAMSGIMQISGTTDREPLKHGLRQGLWCGGLNAAWASVAALLSARRTGTGAWIDLSVHEALASELVLNVAHYAFLGAVQGRRPALQDPLGGDPLHARDGWVSVQTSGLIGPDRLAELFDDPRLAEPRFASSELRTEHADELRGILAEHLAAESAEAFFVRASEAGFLAGFVQGAEQLLACPQLAARQVFHAFDDLAVDGVPVRFPAGLVGLSRTPLRVTGRAPLLGEGTSEPPAWAPRGDEAPPAPQPLVVPSGATDAPGPLHGTRVLDLSTVFAVPYIGGLLADLGADVVKVEPTRRLDQTRTAYGPFTDNDPGERWWDRASTHQVVNRGKRSLTLDLKSDVGRGLLRELVADADVLLENFTPRVMRDWGMTYDELRELNPGLVMLSNTGYGATGPWSGFRAQGTSLEATMGIAAVTGYAEDKPSKAGQSYPDFLACWTGLLALMAALVERDASGLGQHIDLGMYQLGVVVMPEAILGVQATGHEPRRCGNADVGAVVSGLFPAAGEDRWLAVSVREDELAALASVVEEVDASAAAAEIELAVARWSRERPAGQAAALLQAAGVEAGPLLDARDLLLDPHLCARGFYETVDHGDDLGVRTVIGRPFRWHDASTSVGVRRRAPRLGEANAEIGRELGLDAARLADLHADGVMTDHPIGMRPPPRVDLQAMLATRALSGLDADYRDVLAGRCDRG